MSIIKKEIISVEKSFEYPFTIPKYQRPYKWEEHHVKQLFDDIYQHQKNNKSSYRLGTIVVHKEEDIFNVVDGQQRLITLNLLAKSLCLDKELNLLKQVEKSPTTTSIKHLKKNYSILQNQCKKLNGNEERFKKYLLEKSEFVYIELDEIDEAFQFFDSQNSRGKELESYDLLKAYHLREMKDNSEEERFECVNSWEEMVSPVDQNNPSLKLLIDTYLYRIRKWTQNIKSGKSFDKKEIKTFKGISLVRCKYRYANNLRAISYATDEYQPDPARILDNNTLDIYFSIDGTIINGKRFFYYIKYYSDIYIKLFVEDNPKTKKYLDVIKCEYYQGRHRIGDEYVRDLFFCAVFFYYDRFGEEELEQAVRICFLWSYGIRLSNFRVQIETVDNKASKILELFHVIKNAVHPQDVLDFPIDEILTSTSCKATKVDCIKEIFRRENILKEEG